MRRIATNGRVWVWAVIATVLLSLIGTPGTAQTDRIATVDAPVPYNLVVLGCLDVPNASQADGILLQVWDCISPKKTHQLFTIVPAGDGVTYYIKAQHSGKCLDVRGGPGERDDGALVQQWTCTGGANQRWQLFPDDYPTSMYIVARHSGKCLDARDPGRNGALVQQWTCGGLDNQQWSQT